MEKENSSQDIQALCPEWCMDERMNVLFAPLRSKEVNPESWTAKVGFWTGLIERWCTATATLVFDLSLLKTAIVRQGKSPYCLEDVLQVGLDSASFVPPTAYIQRLGSAHQSWGAWMMGLGVNAAKVVGQKVIGTDLAKGPLVVPGVVDRAKSEAYTRLLQVDPFIPNFKFFYITEEQFERVIDQSSQDDRSRAFLKSTLLEERRLIKFCLDKQTFYKVAGQDNDSELVRLDEIDKGVLRLHISLDQLSQEIDRVEQRVAAEQLGAKKALKEGSRTSAKASLRRAKRLETRLEKMLQQQLNLERVYEELLSADTNKKLLLAYNSGLSAMKTMVNPDLTDQAASTMHELAELLDINAEISEALSNKDADADLEKELEGLVLDDSALPDVPKDEPTPKTVADDLPVLSDLQPQIQAKKKTPIQL